MTFSSSLADGAAPLILDTSVLINLHACQQGTRILDTLPNPILVPRPVVDELEHQTSKANGEAHFVSTLISEGKATSAELSESEYELFEHIVAGNLTLGDGEAATVAMAAHRNSIAVIDDRKGRDHARTVSADIRLGWSIDMFLHPVVISGLGEQGAADAIFLALRDGRMRIHESYCDHVVSVIGADRALDCPSLPGYKNRRPIWETQLPPVHAS